MKGKLIAVGVGPGNVELLTLRAVKLIQNASLLAYAVNEKGYSYAREIVKDLIMPNTRELPLCYSMSTDINKRIEARHKVAESVCEELNQGNNVTYITEGDPLTYSTFIHLLEVIPSHIEVEICPGITAYHAGASSSRITLAKENQHLIVISAYEKTVDELLFWLTRVSTVIMYKVHSCIPNIYQALVAANRLGDAKVIQFASTNKEMVQSIEDVVETKHKLPYFSLIIVSNNKTGSDKR